MTPFRHWVHNLWLDNCEERMIFNSEKLNEKEYFHRFKWWFRREYRHQLQKEKEQNERRQRFEQWT